MHDATAFSPPFPNLTTRPPQITQTCFARKIEGEAFADLACSTVGVGSNIHRAKTIDSFDKKLLLRIAPWVRIHGGKSGFSPFSSFFSIFNRLLRIREEKRDSTVAKEFYPNMHGFLVLFSLTDRVTFDGMPARLKELEKLEKPIVLVGTKADLIDERQVSLVEARSLAEEFGVPYFETSAETGEAVDRAYFVAASMALRKLLLLDPHAPKHPNSSSSAGSNNDKGWFASTFKNSFK
jgi:GTPase SAR1 family protein